MGCRVDLHGVLTQHGVKIAASTYYNAHLEQAHTSHPNQAKPQVAVQEGIDPDSRPEAQC